MAEDQNNTLESTLIKALTSIVKEVGFPSFLLLCILSFVVYYATPAQKELVIDKYLLFKDVEKNQLPFCLVAVILLAVIIARDWYWRTKLKIVEAERDRIGKEKSELQRILGGSENPSRTSL